jgi:hypothetical protein
MSNEDLLKKIPKNYKEVNYLKYIQIMQLANEQPEGDFDIEEWNSYVQYAMLSILLDLSITELTALPATVIISLLTSLNFMNVPITNVTSKLEVKSIDEITYNEYVSYNSLVKDGMYWDNMPEILKLLIKNKTQAEIDQLSIYDVSGFFLQLKKGLRKSITYFLICLAFKTMKLIVKETLTKWRMKIFKAGKVS